MYLYDYLKNCNDDEITIMDEYRLGDYTFECVTLNKVYNELECARLQLAKRLKVVYFTTDCVVVALSELIAENIHNFEQAQLFIDYHVDTIMDNMDYYLSDDVDVDWLTEFTDCLD